VSLTNIEVDGGISCLIPIKNGELFILNLENYFDSISRIDLEILIIDDNSIDSSADILRRWASRDKRVRVLHNPGNGLVEALNFGILSASKTWIARFDVDDDYSIDRLSLQARAIDSETVLIFSDYEIMDSSGKSIGLIPGPGSNREVLLALHSNRRTPHSSAFFSKQAAIDAGLYSQHEFLAEDQGLWIRLSRLGKIKSIPSPLLRYRISHTSLLAKNRADATKAREMVRGQADFVNIAKTASREISELRRAQLALNHSEERFLLAVFEIAEILALRGKSLDLFTLIARVIPHLKFRQIPALIRILKLRNRKNKLLQPD
jgi:glycosyltransferase involved in cell wall biosynthesis